MAPTPLRTLLRQLHDFAGGPDAEPRTDRQLLRQFAATRDEGAFTALVRRHGPLVLGVCWRILHHAQDVEDAFQATFVVLARKVRRVAWRESVSGWLHEVACRVARKAQVDRARRLAREGQAAWAPRPESFPERAWQELSTVLDEELRQLPDRYRAPLLLCYLEGQTRDQAARRLGWSLRTLKRRLVRGRELLRLRLMRRGLPLAAALLAMGLAARAASGVPPLLIAATVRAAALLPARVGLLVEGVLCGGFLARRSVTGALVLAVGLLTVGAGLLAPAILTPVSPVAAVAEAPAKPVAEEGLPAGALARLGSTHLRQGDHVWSVAFSADGRTLVSAGLDRTICFWDVATGRCTRRLTGHNGWVTALRMGPDGQTLVSAGWDDRQNYRTAIRVWDLASGKTRRQVVAEGHFGSSSLDLSPDGKTLAASGGWNVVRLWELATGAVREFRCDGVQDYTSNLAFSADGRLLATGGGKVIRVWEVASGKLRHEIASRGQVFALAVAPDSKLLAASCGGSIRLFDAATGENRGPEAGLRQSALSLVFAPDGKTLLAGGSGQTVCLWDVPGGRQLRRFETEHQDQVRAVAFSPDGRFVAGAGGPIVGLWETATGREVHPPGGHRGWVHLTAFAADGRTSLSADSDGSILLWDPTTGKERRQGCGGYVASAAVSSDRRLLAVVEFDRIRLWDLTAGKEIRQCTGPMRGNRAAVFATDGRTLYSGGRDRLIRVWDVASGRQLRQMNSHHTNQVSCLAVSGDGGTLASGGFDLAPGTGKSDLVRIATVRLWNPATGEKRGELRGDPLSGDDLTGVACLAFSPDGRHLAAALGRTLLSDQADSTIRIWDLSSEREWRRLAGHVDGVGALAFSADGRMLASAGGDRTVRLWELSTGKERRCFRGALGPVATLAFSPDGKRLLSGGDSTVLLWAADGVLPGERAEDTAALRQQLGDADAGRAYRALCLLVADPGQSVSYLKDHPVGGVDSRRLARLLAELESERFFVRDKAAAALEELGAIAAPALREVLEKQPGLDVRRRVLEILKKLDGPVRSTEVLRGLRVVEVLERIGTADARRALRALAEARPATWLAPEATAALGRLAVRRN